MQAFVGFIFWWMVFAVVVRSIFLFGKYPRVQSNSVGADTVGLIVAIAVLAWAAWLKSNL